MNSSGLSMAGEFANGGCRTKKAALPGASAPTFSVPGFWNSAPRLLSKYSAGLGAFFCSMCSLKPFHREDEDGTPSVLLWPIPMPYPEVFCSGKFTADRWRKKRLCLQLVLLNWLWLGRPGTAHWMLRLGRKLKHRQWRVVKLLEELAEDENSLLEVDAAMMGRVASKAENADRELGALHRAAAILTGGGSNSKFSCPRVSKQVPSEDAEGDSPKFGMVVGEAKQEKFVAAKPIEADRLTFVGRPLFNPSELYDQKTYEAYVDPLQQVQDDPHYVPPQVKVLASPAEKVKLYKRLVETDRLLLLSEQECAHEYGAGLFSVIKDLNRDRLILDARPANGRERAVGTWTSTVASPFSLGLLELQPGEVLLGSGQDLRDYFYQFQVTKARAKRNCLVGFLSRDEIDYVFGVDARPELQQGVAALNTLAMGDCSACDFAQGAHVMLLLTSGAAEEHELLQARKPPPRGLLSVGAVIDDLVLLERILEKDLDKIQSGQLRTISDDRIDAALRAYQKSHLDTNPGKALHNSPTCKFWGVEMDGKKGVVRPSSTRLLPLIGITFRVCCLGLATCSLLESLAGSWISIFLVRRRLMSSMNLIFEAIAGCSSGAQVIRLSEELVDELFTFCILGSMSWINLRAETLGAVRATDASDWGMAAVHSEQPVNCCRELCRHSIQKSVWSQLLPPGKAWLRTKQMLDESEELPEEQYDCHPLFEVAARALEYKEGWRLQHQKVVHINIAELRAHLKEESHLAISKPSSKQVYGLDSQVALGCLVKGRSSSRSLNRELLRSLPLILGSDLYGFYMFFPSKLNRADGPTRGIAPPTADAVLPSWWTEVANGDFENFDRWMEAASANLLGPASVPLVSQCLLQREAREECKSEKERRSNPCSRKRPPAVPSKSPDVQAEEDFLKHSSLAAEAIEILLSFSNEQICWGDGITLFLHPGALDLFSGRAGVARALCKMGCPWVITFEWCRSSEEDLLDEKLRNKILRLVELKAVRLVGSAIICCSFSIAVTPPCRNHRFPRLLQVQSPLEEEDASGNIDSTAAGAQIISISLYEVAAQLTERHGLWWLNRIPEASVI